MKQKIGFLIMLLAAVFAFSSCSSDDDDYSNSPIVGTWQHADSFFTEMIAFQQNGKVTATSAEADDLSSRYRDSGTYRLDGNKLTIHWTKGEWWDSHSGSWKSYADADETVVITIGISGNELTYYSMEGEQVNEPMVYTRK